MDDVFPRCLTVMFVFIISLHECFLYVEVRGVSLKREKAFLTTSVK